MSPLSAKLTVSPPPTEMIQHLYLDKIEGLFQLVGDVQVGLRRLGDTARVVVGVMCL
jgi:hypothetical protein